MFKELDPKALRRSRYLKDPDKFPPRHPEDAPGGIRRNISEGILYKLEGLQPTNLVPEKYNDPDYLRLSYKGETALADARWLVGGAGPSKLIFLHGQFDSKTGNVVKLSFYTLGNRCLIYDLRTQKVTGRIPPAARWILEQHGHWIVGQDIKALLRTLVVTTFFTIEVRDIARDICQHPKNPFQLPKGTNVDKLGRWLLPLLWFDEYGGMTSAKDFTNLQLCFPQEHLTTWPWDRRPLTEQDFDLTLNNCQVSYLRNCGIADASAVLTYGLLELATEDVTVTINKRITNKVVIPSGCSWDKAVTFILVLKLAEATLTKEERIMWDSRALVDPPSEKAIKEAWQRPFLWQQPQSMNKNAEHPVASREKKLERYKSYYRNQKESRAEAMEIDPPCSSSSPVSSPREEKARLKSVVAAVVEHNSKVESTALRRSPIRAPTVNQQRYTLRLERRRSPSRSRSRRQSPDRGREPSRKSSSGRGGSPRRGEREKSVVRRSATGRLSRESERQGRHGHEHGSNRSRGGDLRHRLEARRESASARTSRRPSGHSRTRSLQRDSSRRNRSVSSPLKYSAAEVPANSTTVVYPHRFQLEPAIEARCPFCAERRGEKHRYLEDCPKYQRLAAKHGSNRANWSLHLCEYAACQEPNTHLVAACPWLHRRCGSCKVRGHSAGPLCQKSNFVLQRMYKAAAEKGAFTRRCVSEPQWQFAPPPFCTIGCSPVLG